MSSDDLTHVEAPPVQPVSWPTGKPHVSFSELGTWMDCAFKHRLINIDKLGSFTPTPHLALGTGVHDANERYIQTHTMEKSIAFDVIEASWRENHKLFTEGPFPDWAQNGFGKVEDWIGKADRIMSDVPAFIDAQFPGWQPYSAEEVLYERIGGQEISFKGMIDAVIDVPDKKGKVKHWIIDWKTCGWGWDRRKQEDMRTRLQLVLYKSFWAKKHGVDIRDIRCAFVLLARDAKPGKTVKLVPVSVGPLTEQRGLTIIDNHIRAVQRGFFPKNRSSCRFCEFADTEHCPPNL